MLSFRQTYPRCGLAFLRLFDSNLLRGKSQHASLHLGQRRSQGPLRGRGGAPGTFRIRASQAPGRTAARRRRRRVARQSAQPGRRDARVTVRLVPDDSLLLRERAAARGMPAHRTFLPGRSHLRSLAPLPDRELEALRSAVMQLAAIGRNLNAMTRSALAGGTAAGPTQEHLRLMLRVSEGNARPRQRDHSRNVVGWEAGYARRLIDLDKRSAPSRYRQLRATRTWRPVVTRRSWS